MQRAKAIALRLMAVGVLGAAIGACSSDLSLNNVTLVPKPDTLLRRPDWAIYSNGKAEFDQRAITPADLVAPDGTCPVLPGAATGFAESGTPEGVPQPSAPAGGIALQMTECEVRSHFARGGFDLRARPGVERLSVAFEQGWFVIKQIHLARAAIHEQLNDALRFRGEVRRYGCLGVRVCGCLGVS